MKNWSIVLGVAISFLASSCEPADKDLTGVYSGVLTTTYENCGSLDSESGNSNEQIVLVPTGNGGYYTGVENALGEESSYNFPDICSGTSSEIILDENGNFNSTCEVGNETFVTSASVKRGVLKIEIVRGVAPACVRTYSFEGTK